jgi:hypothetical protein
MSSPSSASSRAEPTCRTILRRPATDSAICTAVDPMPYARGVRGGARPRIAAELDAHDENPLSGLHRRFEVLPGAQALVD